MSEEDERAFIQRARSSIEATTGTAPVGWLSRYMHTQNTRRLLAEEGFLYHMDDYSDDFPYWDEGVDPSVVVMPYALDSNDMKMWTDPALTPHQWLDYAKANFDQVYREGVEGNPKMMSLGLHLRIIGRPGRIWALEEFFKHVRSKQDV